jgi:ATP-dependent RNA helicase DDX10/DBP4
MKRIVNMDSKIQSLCAGDVELKESAKRALMAYMRSIYLMSNKKLFNLESIDTVKFSQSLGLVVAPRIRFAQRIIKNKQAEEENHSPNEEEKDDEEKKQPKTKRQILQLKQMAKEKEAQENTKYNPFANNADDDEDDSLFTVKRVFSSKDADSNDDEEFGLKNKIKLKSKASVVKQIKKKKFQVNEKIQFDDEGNVKIFDF